MKSLWLKFKQLVIDILFPVACLGCGRPHVWVCDNCRRQLKINQRDLCPACKHPSPYGQTHAWCRQHFPLDGLIVSAVSHNLIERSVHAFKYSLVKGLAPFLSAFLIQKIIFNDRQTARPNWTRLLFSSSLIVVPVPLHPRRLRWRGFNQSYLLACDLCEKFDLVLQPYILQRKKYTSSQAKLKRRQRAKNVRHAFRVNKDWQDKLKMSKILLVDDVATTVSTLNECAKELKKYGTLEVWGIVLTRG